MVATRKRKALSVPEDGTPLLQSEEPDDLHDPRDEVQDVENSSQALDITVELDAASITVRGRGRGRGSGRGRGRGRGNGRGRGGSAAAKATTAPSVAAKPKRPRKTRTSIAAAPDHGTDEPPPEEQDEASTQARPKRASRDPHRHQEIIEAELAAMREDEADKLQKRFEKQHPSMNEEQLDRLLAEQMRPSDAPTAPGFHSFSSADLALQSTGVSRRQQRNDAYASAAAAPSSLPLASQSVSSPVMFKVLRSGGYVAVDSSPSDPQLWTDTARGGMSSSPSQAAPVYLSQRNLTRASAPHIINQPPGHRTIATRFLPRRSVSGEHGNSWQPPSVPPASSYGPQSPTIITSVDFSSSIDIPEPATPQRPVQPIPLFATPQRRQPSGHMHTPTQPPIPFGHSLRTISYSTSSPTSHTLDSSPCQPPECKDVTKKRPGARDYAGKTRTILSLAVKYMDVAYATVALFPGIVLAPTMGQASWSSARSELGRKDHKYKPDEAILRYLTKRGTNFRGDLFEIAVELVTRYYGFKETRDGSILDARAQEDNRRLYERLVTRMSFIFSDSEARTGMFEHPIFLASLDRLFSPKANSTNRKPARILDMCFFESPLLADGLLPRPTMAMLGVLARRGMEAFRTGECRPVETDTVFLENEYEKLVQVLDNWAESSSKDTLTQLSRRLLQHSRRSYAPPRPRALSPELNCEVDEDDFARQIRPSMAHSSRPSVPHGVFDQTAPMAPFSLSDNSSLYTLYGNAPTEAVSDEEAVSCSGSHSITSTRIRGFDLPSYGQNMSSGLPRDASTPPTLEDNIPSPRLHDRSIHAWGLSDDNPNPFAIARSSHTSVTHSNSALHEELVTDHAIASSSGSIPEDYRPGSCNGALTLAEIAQWWNEVGQGGTTDGLFGDVFGEDNSVLPLAL